MTTRIRSFAPRRPRQWGLQNNNGSIVAATHAGNLAFDLQSKLETDLGANLHNVTVSAIRLDITLRFQATAVVGDTFNLHWGITWVSSSAAAAGGVALPDPSDDHADWIAHGQRLVVADVAAVISAPRRGLIEIRNDSMRKQKENDSSLLLICQASVVDDPVTIFLGGRVLFLLP